MSMAADPIVPIPAFEELSPAFQARSRRGATAVSGSGSTSTTLRSSVVS